MGIFRKPQNFAEKKRWFQDQQEVKSVRNEYGLNMKGLRGSRSPLNLKSYYDDQPVAAHSDISWKRHRRDQPKCGLGGRQSVRTDHFEVAVLEECILTAQLEAEAAIAFYS